MRGRYIRKWFSVILILCLLCQYAGTARAAAVQEETAVEEGGSLAESSQEESASESVKEEESVSEPEEEGSTSESEEETVSEPSTETGEETLPTEETPSVSEPSSGEEEESAGETGETVEQLERYGDAPRLQYSTHVQTYGWQEPVSEGKMSGTENQSKRLEGIKIWLNNPQGVDGSVQYRTHVQTYGWQGWVGNGQMSGTSGQSKRLEAIEIQLTGGMAEKYDIYYRVHSQTYGWLGWAKNGEVAGTSGYSKRLEAIEIVLVDKGGKAPGSTEDAFLENIKLQYSTHVQTYGWQDWASNGEMSGTSGQSKRLEGIKIQVSNLTHTQGGLQYRTHVQTYGWQGWVGNGQMSGTSGESKRLEAIEIQLTGDLAGKYDIYYRTHVQTFGWTGWAKNGEACGSTGYSKRLEAIEIRLIQKGKNVPVSSQSILFTPNKAVRWGIDVSHWQEGTNWKRAKADGVEFAMLRLTQQDKNGREVDGTTIYIRKDESLDDNLMGTAVNGIPIGGYVYNFASTPEEARAEARYAISLLKGYQVTYPIAFDLERKEHMNTAAKLNNMAMAKAFCDEIRAAGYTPIVYGSPSKLRTCFDYGTVASLYNVWLARYRWSDDVMDFSDVAVRQMVTDTGYEGGNYTGLSNVHIWQFTERGRVAGVPGYSDLDVAYKAY